MGCSNFEFRPIEAFQYVRGFLVREVQKPTGTLCFALLVLQACKFGCPVQTYIVSGIFQLQVAYLCVCTYEVNINQ